MRSLIYKRLQSMLSLPSFFLCFRLNVKHRACLLEFFCRPCSVGISVINWFLHVPFLRRRVVKYRVGLNRRHFERELNLFWGGEILIHIVYISMLPCRYPWNGKGYVSNPDRKYFSGLWSTLLVTTATKNIYWFFVPLDTISLAKRSDHV